ncbi:LlaMI family restriction endonuclease [Candidatus Nitrosotenuis cloacae]|uniref:LlaMI family restriction endonuclease n=1 Tax=Candidatus Nitrosotenuis cloacae TaxID=1603555 RepID=UPI0022814552|nr:LlaMI family restriction endonuclease [Candidatus Nitrosotenuis cloacae]
MPSKDRILEIRKEIIGIYVKNVHGKRPDTGTYNSKHDGKGGHWLERQMGLAHNNRTAPDLLDHEMKNDTTSKTTFGDWSADYYIFKDDGFDISRDKFLKIFGHPNPEKGGRYSWSGEPVPKIGVINSFGQGLFIDEHRNIVARYSYSKDTRPDKSSLVPEVCRMENLTIARWDADSLKAKVEKKFNRMGWFKCLRDKDGVYRSIVFGDPISYETWLKFVLSGDIFFDSGMYSGNPRPYSQWRANNSLWDKLVVMRFPE